MKKKKIEKQEKEFRKDIDEIYLIYREAHSGGEKEDPSDKWSTRTDQVIEFYPEKLTTTKGSFQETIPVDFKASDFVGKPLWMVVIRYSSGDTFGRSTGNWTILGAYTDQKTAELLASLVIDHDKAMRTSYRYSKEGMLVVKNANETFDLKSRKYLGKYFYKSWVGYFEQFENVEIHEFMLRSDTQDPDATDSKAGVSYFKH